MVEYNKLIENELIKIERILVWRNIKLFICPRHRFPEV